MSFPFLVGGTLGPRKVGPLMDEIVGTCLIEPAPPPPEILRGLHPWYYDTLHYQHSLAAQGRAEDGREGGSGYERRGKEAGSRQIY